MVNPWDVRSPQARLRQLRVIHHTVDWSLAIGVWDRGRVLLVRWNGDASRPLGNPVSSANPTWFVLPDDFYEVVLDNLVSEPNRTSGKQWLGGSDPSHWIDPVSNCGLHFFDWSSSGCCTVGARVVKSACRDSRNTLAAKLRRASHHPDLRRNTCNWICRRDLVCWGRQARAKWLSRQFLEAFGSGRRRSRDSAQIRSGAARHRVVLVTPSPIGAVRAVPEQTACHLQNAASFGADFGPAADLAAQHCQTVT
jgi:hypothetical protein